METLSDRFELKVGELYTLTDHWQKFAYRYRVDVLPKPGTPMLFLRTLPLTSEDTAVRLPGCNRNTHYYQYQFLVNDKLWDIIVSYFGWVGTEVVFVTYKTWHRLDQWVKETETSLRQNKL